MFSKLFRRSMTPVRKAKTNLSLVSLEARDVPATFLVINTNDAGLGSLRQAVINANNFAGPDTISFNATFDVAKTISLTTGELFITDGVSIDGPGSSLLTVRNGGTDRVINFNSANPVQQTLNLDGLTLRDGNPGGASGGGVFVSSEKLTANDVRFLENQTTNNGGAIFASSSIVHLTNCEVNGNEAKDGGAIYGNSDSVVTLFNTDVVGNTASSTGGGVYVRPFCTLVVSASELRNNSSSNGSGGALLAIDSDLTVLDSLIVGNTADRGGGIFFSTGDFDSNTATLRNSTISGNRSTFTFAGGVFLDGSASDKISIQNCTITANTADINSIGGVYIFGITDNLIESTIISGNTAPNNPDIATTVSVKLKNSAVGVITNVSHTDLGGNFLGLSTTQLKLGPLLSNGGPRQSHAVSFGSPIQDKGSNPGGSSTDVRGAGFIRDVGGPDIGAYENQSSTNVTNTNDAGPGSLRQAVLTSNAMIGGNTITFSSLFDTPQTISLTSGQLTITEGVSIAGPGSELLTVRNGGTERILQFDSALPAMQTLNLNNLTLRDGNATNGIGGALRIGAERLTAIGVRFLDNKTTNNGGAVEGTTGSILTFRDCEFSGNQGSSGGAVHASGGSIVTFLNTSLRDNTAASGGGAITTGLNSTISISGCTIEGNSSDFGGGLSLGGTAVAIVDSLIANNTAASAGGGATINHLGFAVSVSIRNTTISGNRSTGGVQNGGAIHFVTDIDDPVSIDNCTVTENLASSGGDGFDFNSIGGATLAITSSLIVGNGTSDIDTFTPIDLKASVIGTTNVTFNDLGGNFLSATTTSIKLGPLADNGGDRLSHALAAGSPILNKGTNPSGAFNDNRGGAFLRDVGGIDIGSYERQAEFVVTNANDSGPGSLRQALANADAVANTTDLVTFDPVFFSTPRFINTGSKIDVNDGVEIVGPGAGFVVIVASGHAGLTLNADSVNNSAPQDSILSGLTFANSSGTLLDNGTLRLKDGHYAVRDCNFLNNSTNSRGGAINATFTDLVVERCNFIGNSTDTDSNSEAGGAIYSQGNLTVRGSTFQNNVSHLGGAIFMGFGTAESLLVENSTFSGNSAFNGGAIFIDAATDSIIIRNSTFVSNIAETAGGAICTVIAPNDIDVESSVFSGNLAPGAGDDIRSFNSVVRVLKSALFDGTGFDYINLGGNLPFGTDAKLGFLAFNGGTTRTHAPLVGSPLINAGTNTAGLLRDQRGGSHVRISGPGVDIGAVEVQAPPTATVSVDHGSAQRSMVRSVTVTFNRVVNLGANPFDVVRLGPGNPSGPVAFTVDTSLSTPQQTIAKLTWTADPTFTLHGSIIDGNYRIIVIAAQVSDGSGQQLDGNFNGTGGDSAIVNFHRLFGDVNGDKTVDGTDFAAFGNSFNIPDFRFDYQVDGTVDGSDLAQFGNRFGVTL